MSEQRENLQKIKHWVQSELTRSIDFWLTNGMDAQYGGVLTCLDRQGRVFSTDKSVWMQGRCAWLFAHLYNSCEKKEEWLAASRSCLDFLEDHCINRSAGNRMYFTVTQQGKPLRQRRYCFSEGFYAMANAEYYLATGEGIYLERARRAYDMIYHLNHGGDDPTGLGAKTIPETRSGRALADPMIYLNLTSVMRRADPGRRALYDQYSAACVEDIFQYHHKPQLGCTLETVGTQGEFQSEFTAGRVVNPGHSIECSWFVMEEANRRGDRELHAKAQEMLRLAVQIGWDKDYGGLLYFVDCLGKPPEAYEHDMKLWWPHNEMMIATLMAYRDTGSQDYLTLFYQVVEYCQRYFADPEWGEWYGYLRRDGQPTAPPCKGSTFKGPFHVPRSLLLTHQMLVSILQQ